MPRKDKPQEADPEQDSAPRRSSRVPQPARKVVEWREQQLEAQLASDAANAATVARAEKRARDYTLEELEELIQDRRKERRLEEDAEDDSCEPAPTRTQSGVNLGFVNRVRQVHANTHQGSEPVEPEVIPTVNAPSPNAPSPVIPLANPSTRPRTSTPLSSHASARAHTPIYPSTLSSHTSSRASTPTPGGSRRVLSASLDSDGRMQLRHHLFRPNPQHSYDHAASALDGHRVDSPTHSSQNPFFDNSTQAHRQQVTDYTDDQDPFGSQYQPSTPASPHPFVLDDFVPEQQASPVPSTPNLTPRAFAGSTTASPAISAPKSSMPTHADDSFTLNSNNNPKSPTYGNGDGDLLPPRRISTRTLPDDLKSLGKKERKQARNRMRAKASDYADTENKILQAATLRIIALSVCQDPLPTTERENALSEQCWAWAAGFLQKRITHDRDLLYLLKRNLVNHRTGLSSAANDIVASHYKFRINTNKSHDTNSSIELFNSDLAIELLNKDSFVFGDYKTREDPYQNELISFLFLKLWFQDARSAGVHHPDIFLPVRITTLAYIVTVLEKAIKEWKPGSRKTISFSGDSHRSRLDYFEGQIKKFCDHPLIKEERIYDDYILELERSARKNIKLLAVVKIEDDAHSGDEDSGGGLNDADIERLLRKRKQAKKEVTDVETGKSAGDDLELSPSANSGVNAGGKGGLSEVRRGQVVGSAEPSALGLDIGIATSYETSDLWDSQFTQMHASQFSVPTIYPKDSISQQIPSNAANFVPPPSGYLEQLRNPFM